ncbi:MAG TPA: hypothetical protein VKE74_12280 [Gemmataceae bacterium]|nr:hypothetical protein [Gemmataceae bacterium]
MALRILFTVHSLLTFAAGVVLVAAPEAIPRAVGIQIEPKAYLLCYLLAAAEFAVSALSWGARTITDAKALRVVVTACIVLHAASGLLEVYAFAAGLSGAVLGNVALRALVVVLFAYFGLRAAPSGRASVGW